MATDLRQFFVRGNKLVIQHVTFEKEGVDENGYPISKYINGEPVIANIKFYGRSSKSSRKGKWKKRNSLTITAAREGERFFSTFTF